MKTPKKTTGKKSAPEAKKKSVLNKTQSKTSPGFVADDEEEDFDLPMNDLELDELDAFDEDDDEF